VKLKGVPGQKPGVLNYGGIDVDLASLPVDRELEIMPGLRCHPKPSVGEST
jgi:hypothetical protein